MTTNSQIIERIEQEKEWLDALTTQARIDHIGRFMDRGEAPWLATIIQAWEDHCEESGHTPVSQGGTATYASTSDASAAVCRVPGCQWFIITQDAA